MLKSIRDFNLKFRLFVFVSLFIFLYLSTFAKKTFPQDLYQPPIIEEVSVMVDNNQADSEIRRLISVKKGDSFSLKKITESIKQAYKTGLFSDIQVLKEGEQNISLTYILKRKLITQAIIFRGNLGVPQKKLKENMYALREGEPFSEDGLKHAVGELKEYLYREGYFNPEIKTLTDRNSQTSQVNVFLEVLSAEKFIVHKINFDGSMLLAEEKLRKKMLTREGKIYIPSLVAQDIDRLKEIYASMDYRRAEINVKEKKFDKENGFVSIIIEIIPNEKIEIAVNGAKVPLNLLKPIWEARIFEEWGLSEGEAKIINYIRKKGFIFVNVTSHIERDENRTLIVHDIIPGIKYKILNISFKGLQYFTSSQIKNEVIFRTSIPFLGKINGNKLFELPKEIEFFYKTHGFSSAKVDLNFEIKGNKAKPIYFIEEGNQEKIKILSIEGAHLFSKEELIDQIYSFQDKPFFQPNIQKDIESLENFYLNQGIRGTKVNASVKKMDNSLFRVNFQIKEGSKIKVEDIIITGNKVTRKNVILKELVVKKGELARYDLIKETKRNLEKLGIFSEVRIDEIPLSSNKENLLINVREGERNYAGLGIGLETKNEPRSFYIWNNVIRLRGTGEIIHSNLFGLAAQISLVGQVSLKERRGVVSLEQPYFFGLPLRTFLNAWLEKEERKSYSFDRRGVSLSAVKSLSGEEDMLLLFTLRFARTTLYDLQVSESEIDRQFSPFSASSLSGSFILDRRNDPFNPEKGYFFSSALEWAYPLFKSESDYLKSFTKYQQFLSIFPGITLGSTARMGLGQGMIPIHERFFGGGSNSFRGVEFDELGPKDPLSLKPIGGKALILFNFELIFPLFSSYKNLLGAIFYDKGNVFAKGNQMKWGALEDALGLGIRYRTPLGPFRFELGWNLDAPEGESKVLAFITIGNVF